MREDRKVTIETSAPGYDKENEFTTVTVRALELVQKVLDVLACGNETSMIFRDAQDEILRLRNEYIMAEGMEGIEHLAAALGCVALCAREIAE